jgi:hypothetical protein
MDAIQVFTKSVTVYQNKKLTKLSKWKNSIVMYVTTQ